MTLLEVAPVASGAAPAETVHPVVVIGAGPVGLAAAAHLLERGLEPLVLEQGDSAGAATAGWGHVRLFSPWREIVDAAAVRLLTSQGWRAPHPEAMPTGAEVVRDYLAPLAAALGARVRSGVRVEAVTRHGMDRTRSPGRDAAPFALRLAGAGAGAFAGAGELLARAVIDASGTTATPNPVLASGLPVRGAAALGDRMLPPLPDVLGAQRALFVGRHTVVVGAGHSAATTLIALARLAEQEPESGTRATWVIRSAAPTRVYGSDADELPGRATLGSAARALVESGAVELVAGMTIDDVTPENEDGRPDDGLRFHGRIGAERIGLRADRLVVATVFRPDLAPLRELRLALDEVVEAPRALAPLINPDLHSCGSVPPHGVVELTHPESGFFVAGLKSYGRAPTFLLLTGYEQVRSIAAELAGDRAGARRVQLVLPETGLCSTALPLTEADGAARSSCCR